MMRALLVALLLAALPALGAELPPLPPLPAPPPALNLVTEGELQRVIEGFLLKKGEGLNTQLVIKKISHRGDLTLPPGRVSFEVVAPDRWGGYGRASLALIVRVDGQVKKNLPVVVEVEALTEMVVATRTLERGEVLTPADLALVARDLSQVQGRFVKSIDEVVGLRVKNPIRANTPLRGDYLERVPVVKSGQLVTILAENEMVRITASGKAKGAGAVGDSIMVMNLSSQKDVAARVLDATTVQVDF